MLGRNIVAILGEEIGRPPSLEKLSKRMNNFILIPGKVKEIITFSDFIESHEEYTFTVNKIGQESNVLRGEIAYNGKVTGRVKILKRKDQVDEIQEGEIIVSPMTTPDFLPAMQKAAAFVTDEGGVICHAAIIARELKKPCIVGTKNATSVLYDGDYVEVDAEKGVVRVLKTNISKQLLKSDINLNKWEFEFQQRAEQPILLADFFCRAISIHFLNAIQIKIDSYDYIFTDSSKGYNNAVQKKVVFEQLQQVIENDVSLQNILKNSIQIPVQFNTLAHTLKGAIKDEAIDNEKLAEYWKEMDAEFLKVIPWFWYPWYISKENWLTDRVKSRLQKYHREIENITDLDDALMTLIFPVKKTAFQLEQEDMKRLVSIAEVNPDFVHTLSFKREAEQYLKKYGWLTTFILAPLLPMTFQQLVVRVTQAMGEGFKDNFEQQKKIMKKNEEKAKKILFIVKNDLKLRDDIENARELGYVLTAGIEEAYKSSSQYLGFMQLVAKRIGVSFEDIKFFLSSEICGMLKREIVISTEELNERRKGFVMMILNHKQYVLFGKEGHAISDWVDCELHKVNLHITKLKGQTACTGFAEGKARIVLKPSESYALAKGEILVCPMTNPDYVMAMKRAAAIITDEGGLLSHAAIMSREFNKPCVIGTKYATRVFKTGDLVEVDGEKGIVRKIESQQHEWPLRGEIFHWGPIPGRLIWSGAEFLEVCCETVYERFGMRWPQTLMLFKDKRMLWLNELDALTEFGKQIFLKYMLPSTSWKKIYHNWEKALHKLLLFEKKLDAVLLRTWSNDLLRLNWLEFHALLKEFWVWTIPTELGNYGSPDLLEEALRKYIRDKKELASAMEILTAPEELSFYQQEEIDLLQTRDLKKHLNKYFWLKNSYAGAAALDVAFFLKRKKKLDLNLKREMGENVLRTQLRKKELVKKYRLPVDVVHLANVISDNVMWQDRRKKYIFKNIYYKDLFLKEIVRRFGYSYDDLQNLDYGVVGDIISGETMRTVVDKRRGAFGFYFESSIRCLDAAKALRYWEHYAEEKVNADVTEFNGVVACAGSGKVRGRVRIVLDPHAIDDFVEGDILVAPMTSPEYVFVMKKASAIITDTGGLTSHAAIVSRELKKVCLVGCKIATKVLKDGDLVEVDAERGIVKIIKRSKIK